MDGWMDGWRTYIGGGEGHRLKIFVPQIKGKNVPHSLALNLRESYFSELNFFIIHFNSNWI